MQVLSGMLQLVLLLAAQHALTLASPVRVTIEELVTVDTSELLESSGSGGEIDVDSEQDQIEDEEYINSCKY